MAVTAAQAARSGQSGTSTVTIAITTTAGNLLGIATGAFGSGLTGAPSRTGETNNNAVANFQDAGSQENLRGDYMMNIGGNSNSVVCTGNSLGTSGCVHELQGAKTTAALGSVNHGISATTTVQPGSITPTAGSALITAVVGNAGGSTAATIDSSFTVDETGGAGTVWDQNGAVCGSAHLDNVAASAVNPTWTTHWTGTTHMGALVMEFLAAAGGGSALPFFFSIELLSGQLQRLSGGFQKLIRGYATSHSARPAWSLA